jgi:hypothetical protein
MEIKILGTGCTKCRTLEKLTREVVSEMGINASIEKVEDILKIMEYNVIAYARSCDQWKGCPQRQGACFKGNQGNKLIDKA